jgi:glycine cleavage system aminomethyltransferase T
VAKRLVTLALDAGATGAPPPGTPLVAGGKPTGHITSVAPSPTTGGLIALGYVHRDLAGTGQRVLVGDTGVTAEVTGLAG